MKIRQAVFPFMLLELLFCVTGCDTKDIPESTQTLQVTEVAKGPNIRLLPITSEKYYFYEKEKEIRARLEGEINGGKRNIVAVKTSYSSGYLTSGEIIYDISDSGEGSNLRVLFIYSDKHYWDEKMKEVQPRLNEIVNSGKYDICKIQTVYARGHLLAAEVYYRSK